jgi:hypothetical protein
MKVAGSQFDHVSGHDLVDRRRNDGPVAQNVGVDRHRALEGFGSEFGAMFLHHVEQDRQADDCRDDGDPGEITGKTGDDGGNQ